LGWSGWDGAQHNSQFGYLPGRIPPGGGRGRRRGIRHLAGAHGRTRRLALDGATLRRRSVAPVMTAELHDARGRRLYLTGAERAAFLAAAAKAPWPARTLGGVLAHTGCRVSEALQLTAERTPRWKLRVLVD
jgi:integrase